MLFLQDLDGVKALMKEHAEILSPKFKTVEKHLNEGLQGRGMGSWSSPRVVISFLMMLLPEPQKKSFGWQARQE